MGQFLPTTAELLGLVIGTLLYGMYLVIFLSSMWFLLGDIGVKSRTNLRARPLNKAIVAANIVLFMTISVQWAIEVSRNFKGFIEHGNDPLGPLIYLTGISDPPTVAKLGFYALETFISDSIMIYRLWIVWQRSYVTIIAPACMFIAGTMSGIMFLIKMRLLDTQDFFESACGKWMVVSLTCTVSTNVYCSALLAFKVWATHRAVEDSTRYLRSSMTTRVLSVIIESALLFTVSSIVMLIVYSNRSFALFTCINAAAPITGIAYTIIIVRFGIRGTFRDGRSASAGAMASSQPSSSARSNVDIPMKHLAINLNVTRHVEGDSIIDPGRKYSEERGSTEI